jgi:hypothetical protein
MFGPSLAPTPTADIAMEQKFRKFRFRLVNYPFGEVLVRPQLHRHRRVAECTTAFR